MSGQKVGAAIAQREADKPKTPGAMVKAYSSDFASVLPTHIKPATWVRLAQGALKKGKPYKENGRLDPYGRTELEVAAANNPGVFLAALLDAARLGLDPGTEQYYLTPRRVKGKLEILGIPGYQGYIELMYRAGAISSVVAEVVHANDKFRYQPGVDERPVHEIDWDAEDRGALRLAYAYAVMKDGATSRVVVLNKAAIEKIKKSATAADSDYSPWKTHEPAMWLKSAVRQLAKWVPTSAEYIREQIRAAQDVAGENAPASMPSLSIPDPDEILDAELVDDEDQTDAQPASPVPAESPVRDPGVWHDRGHPGVESGRLHSWYPECEICKPDQGGAEHYYGHTAEPVADCTGCQREQAWNQAGRG